MPSYRTHVALNLCVGLPLCAAFFQAYVQLSLHESASFYAAFVYGTLFLSPDLDLIHKVKLFSIRGILTLPFRPYSLFFKHRGISHIPILGTLTRLLWLFALIYPFFTPSPLFWFAALGLLFADTFHVLLDSFKKKI